MKNITLYDHKIIQNFLFTDVEGYSGVVSRVWGILLVDI